MSEYASMIDDIILESNNFTTIASDLTTRHVGFSDFSKGYDEYFSVETIRLISTKVTELTRGVDPRNRPIVVPDKLITNIMNSIYESYRPRTGDIYSRYNIPSGFYTNSYVVDMVNQVIEVIVSDISNNLGAEQQNHTLSVWTTVLGDFNDKGLRQYSTLKIRNKRPSPFQFFSNY